MKSFVITLEDAQAIKIPRIRKANVRSNLNDLLNDKNDDDRVDYDNPDLYFNSKSNSSN